MKPSVFITAVSLLVLTDYVYSLNILGIFPYQGKSHFIVFRVYLRELARRGHNVTVISHFPDQDPPARYHDISLAGSIKAIEDDTPFENSYLTLFLESLFLADAGVENCNVMLANNRVQSLVKEKPKFDMIVVEQFNSDCALGIAHKLGAPVVGIMSHILMPYHYQRLGVPYNPAYVPFHFSEGETKPTLYQRVERTILDFYFRKLNQYYTQRSNQNALAQYFDEIPPLEDLAREMKFLLVYHHFTLTGSRLFPSNVIEIGGFHVVDAKPLTGVSMNTVYLFVILLSLEKCRLMVRGGNTSTCNGILSSNKNMISNRLTTTWSFLLSSHETNALEWDCSLVD